MASSNGFPADIENGDHLVSMSEGIEEEINEDLLCEQCFEELTSCLPVNNSQLSSGSAHDSSRSSSSCFTCDAPFLERRHVTLREGPEHDEIARISQEPVPLNVKVCQACWFVAYRNVRRQRRHNQLDTIRNIDGGDDDVAPFNLPIIIAESCVLCDRSLQQRTHILPEDPEQNKNIQYIIFLKD